MTIPQEASKNQYLTPKKQLKPRKERRPEQIKQQKQMRKLQRKLDKIGMPIYFDNDTVTGHGNFQFVEQFKTIIGLEEILDTHISLVKGHNSYFSVKQMLDLQLDALIFGISRFTHLNGLKNDPGYQKQKGFDRLPDESTFRELYEKATPETLKELEKVSLTIIHKRAEFEGPKVVWVDIDDRVVTLFGNQEEGKTGYNPRYHGRPSYKLRVATIHETREIIALELLDGCQTGHYKDINGFLDKIEASLPRNYVLAGIRADSGFFDETNLEWAEDRELDYFIKAKQNSTIKTVIDFLDREQRWEDLDDTYSVAEARFPLKSWKFERRFVFIRQKLPPKDPRQFELIPNYKHQVIVTRSDDGTPEEIWHGYNPRGDVENVIKEISFGFAADEESQQSFLKNRCYTMVKAIAYNLVQWLKSAILPAEISSYNIASIRREIINIPGNVVSIGGGKNRVRLAVNHWLERIANEIKTNIQSFFQVFCRKMILNI